LSLLASAGPAHAGKYGWLGAKASSGITWANVDKKVVYTPATSDRVDPRGKIDRVSVNGNWTGNEIVSTKLCWNGVTHCAEIFGTSGDTGYFEGLAADKPLYLVHRVLGSGSVSPAYVYGVVSVSYDID